MYVCICNAVSERQIVAAVDAGAVTLAAVSERLGVATCCGRCAECARALIERTRALDGDRDGLPDPGACLLA